MNAARDTIALTPCHWCHNDRPQDLTTGQFFSEARTIIECADTDACDARALTAEARA